MAEIANYINRFLSDAPRHGLMVKILRSQKSANPSRIEGERKNIFHHYFRFIFSSTRHVSSRVRLALCV